MGSSQRQRPIPIGSSIPNSKRTRSRSRRRRAPRKSIASATGATANARSHKTTKARPGDLQISAAVLRPFDSRDSLLLVHRLLFGLVLQLAEFFDRLPGGLDLLEQLIELFLDG